MRTFKNSILLISASVLFLSCKDTANEAGVMGADPQQATIDSLKIEMEQQKAEMSKQKTIDSMNAVAATQRNNRPVIVNNQAPAAAATPAEQKRKGWSGAAKGAVIGAGVGAIGGAVINKKDRGTGAVIGGLAGAGLGAGTGAILDSEKKKKAAQQ